MAQTSPHLRPASASPTQRLVDFVADLAFRDLPNGVIARTEELFLDWLAAAMAGRNAAPVRCLERFAQTMGPSDGASEVLVSRRRTSPLFAALINAAASHVVEQDDIHNASVMHPGTVVFPPALAVAQALGSSGRELITAAVAGYEVACRVGEFLGPSHYRVFHTTGTAGTLAAAGAVAHLLGLDASALRHALGTAGTQAAGLWEFLRDAGDSKQLHTAKAAADGLLAAFLTQDGFTGAQDILTGERGMAAGMSAAADPDRLSDGLGHRWAVLETSFKWHAACRHTHPCADALLTLMDTHRLSMPRIARVRAHVYQAAQDVLGAVTEPQTVHQAKFSMGFVLALIASHRHADIDDFNEATLHDPDLRDWMQRVDMVVDPSLEAAYPQYWMGKVVVETIEGEVLEATVETPKGDPANSLSRDELEQKARRSFAFRDGASSTEARTLIELAWELRNIETIGSIFERAH